MLFLAMRYVEGTDLRSSSPRTARSSPKRAVDLLAQVAEALDAAHAEGLVHRDVKPSNILIASPRARALLPDRLRAHQAHRAPSSGVSVAGEIVGTLEYVAPGADHGRRDRRRADVYSLGCVLYECLTGQSPSRGDRRRAAVGARSRGADAALKARPDLPKELDTVLTRALAKEPGRRYRSAGELLAATRSALRLGDRPGAPSVSPRSPLAIAASIVL